MWKIVSVIAVIVGTIWLLGWYLGPDDLAGCDPSPAGTGKCAKADAVVTFSGGDTTARTEESIRLYQRGWADKLIFSGAAQDKSGPSNAEAMRDIAVEAGVAPTDIMLDEMSENTQQNAVNTKRLIDDNGIKSVVLVTSAYHQRRASIEFGRVADGVQIRNHPTSSDNQWAKFWWLSPTSWFLVISESIKILIISFGARV